ncbi:MAG: T9SS type A sorting domain-containing protein [Flavobacteriales bacterium]
MRTLLLLAAALPTVGAIGQTITSADAPAPGDQYTYVIASWVDVPQTGGNQTWDMSGAIPNGAMEYSTFATVAATTGGGSFASADVAQVTPTANAFMDAPGNGLYIIGSYDIQNAVTIQYTNTAKVMQFPCSNGTTWTDPWSYSATIQGTTYTMNGTYTYNANGYGSVILPWGTLNNVLRLQSTEQSTQTGGGSTLVTTILRAAFFRPGTPIAIGGSITYEYELDGTVVQTGEQSYYLQQGQVGVNELTSNAIGVDVMPNPATDAATVVFGAEGDVQLNLVDLSGRTILTQKLQTLAPGIHTQTIDVSGLASGSYMVNVTNTRGERGTRTLIVD